MHSVSDGYFESLGAQMAQGRAFSAFDTRRRAGGRHRQRIVRQAVSCRTARRSVAVPDVGDGHRAARTEPEARAAGAAAGAPPLPHLPPTPFEIVGVVKDIRNVPLGQTVEPAVYFTTRQFPFRELFLTVRATDTSTAVAAVRTALKNVAPSVPMARAQTWGERFGARTAQSRLLMTILVFFGGLAGLLAAHRRLRAVLVVGGAAHARAGDPADARRPAGERRQPRRSPKRGARRRRARRSASC